MKKLIRKLLVASLAAACLAAVPLPAQTGAKFDDVYQLIRGNLKDVQEDELQRLAIEGFVSRLEPRVRLVQEGEQTPGGVVSRVETYDGVGYFRLSRIERGAADAFRDSFKTLSEKGPLQAVILDLRYGGGEDYSQAAAIADQFMTTQRPLLDWETGSAASTRKESAIALPIAVLVNEETRGAPEALAAVLHEMRTALVLGAPTAGQANIYKSFPLEKGRELQVAMSTVRLGSGKALPEDGIKPDIDVAVTGERERIYFEDPHATAPETAGGVPVRRRPTEADLVREQRERLNPGVARAESREDAQRARTITDPVLARAVDALKAIAIIYQKRAG